MIARSRVARSKGAGGFTVEGVPTDRAGSIEDATGTRAFSTSGFARRRFLPVFFTRAPLFAPTSANTSNVQRMLRPARSGRIRFAMATGHRNARAGRFPAEFRDRGPRSYKSVIGRSTLRPASFRRCCPTARCSRRETSLDKRAEQTGRLGGSTIKAPSPLEDRLVTKRDTRRGRHTRNSRKDEVETLLRQRQYGGGNTATQEPNSDTSGRKASCNSPASNPRTV
jgi:hypothetical protein